MTTKIASVRCKTTKHGTYVIKVFPRPLNGEVCILCGDYFIKSVHHIVPLIYRDHFPADVKVANSTVNMCPNCHHMYEDFATPYREEIARRYIPESNEYILKDGILYRACYVRLREAKTYALPMLKHHDVLPTKKRAEFDAFLRDFFDGDYSDEDLLKLIKKDLSYAVKAGEMVVRQFKDKQEYTDFCVAWKQHFLTSMKITEEEILERGRVPRKQ